MGIENHYAPCPYSEGASFSTLKSLWIDLEEKMPGRKMDFYHGFLERGKPAFQSQEEEHGQTLAPCARCGYPTSTEVCGVCLIREALAARN